MGCLLVNTGLEVSPHDSEIGRLIEATPKQGRRLLSLNVEAGQREGTIRADLSATETAQLLFGLFLGLRVITRSCPDAAMMNAIVNQAEELLG